MTIVLSRSRLLKRRKLSPVSLEGNISVPQNFEERLEKLNSKILPSTVEAKERVANKLHSALKRECLREAEKREANRQFLHKKLGIKNSGFHASQFHSCVRRIYFDLTLDRSEFEEDESALFFSIPEDVQNRIFGTGDFIHDRLQRYLKNAFGEDVSIEFPVVSAKTNSYGRIDGVLVIDGILYIIEIKSMRENAFIQCITGPLAKFKRQGCVYAEFLNIKQAIFILENKNNQEWKIFVETYSDDDFEVIRQDKETVNVAMRQGKPPIRHKLCTAKMPLDFCPYSSICW